MKRKTVLLLTTLLLLATVVPFFALQVQGETDAGPDQTVYVDNTVAFNATVSGEGTGTYQKDGDNSTNSTGFVTYNFAPGDEYSEGKQNWNGYVDLTETCYNYNASSNYNVTVEKAKTITLVNGSVK